MKQFRTRLATVAVCAAATVYGARLATVVSINGKPASEDTIEKDGRTYVSLKDMADALRLKVLKTDKGFDLVGDPERRANDLSRFIESNKYRYKATSVERSRRGVGRTVREGSDVFVVHGVLVGDDSVISVSDGFKARITDVDDRVYEALPFRVGRSLFRGEQGDIVMEFEVPEGFKPNKLTFDLKGGFNSAHFEVDLRR